MPTERNPQKINSNHENFIDHYIRFNNATQAYMKAYPNCSYKMASIEACSLLKSELIQAELQDRREKLTIINNREKASYVKDLEEQAKVAKKNGKLKEYAIIMNMLNKMFGFYEAEKIQHSGELGIEVIQLTEIKKKEDLE